MRFSFGLPALALATTALAGLEDAKYSTALSFANFEQQIKAPSVGTLVAFFAPWCGHCKNLEPAWTKAAQAFEDDDRCRIAHYNADEKANKPLAGKFGVQGYPTLKFIPSDGSDPISYQSPRTEAGILEFMNEHCGTHYESGGVLGKMAGRIASLDALAAIFLGPSALLRKDLLSKATSIVSSLSDKQPLAAYYTKVMAKFVDSIEGAAEWVNKEKVRLGKIAAKKGAVAGKQLDEIKMKKNVLGAFEFVKEKADEAEKALEKVAETIKDEL